MAYHVPDESSSSNWVDQNGGSYENSSGHIWGFQASTGAAYQSFEGGPVSPQSVIYPPEWGYHATADIPGPDYQAYDHAGLHLAPIGPGIDAVGSNAFGLSGIGSRVMSPVTEHQHPMPGNYPEAYQASWSRAHQDVHLPDFHEQGMYMLDSGLFPAPMADAMVPGSQCSTTMSSTSPQSPPYLERQCTSPRGLGDAEYSVPCPYRCGTILTGVHAIGNLTRHIKSQSCTASGRTKAKYPCPIGGCDREYTRSDGLKVHMRRRHNAPPALPKNDAAVENDDD